MKSVQFFKRLDLLSTKPVLLLLKWLHSALLKTLKVSIKGKENLFLPTPLIIALWHNQIALVPLLVKLHPTMRLRLVISHSQDGRKLAAFAKLYPNVEITSVPHNRRREALRDMVQALEAGKEILLITPDGPRGPLYQVKPGVIYSAQATKTPVIAMKWQSDRFWQFSSWDKMRLPRPFSKVSLTFEKPFHCPADLPLESLQQQLASLLSS